MKESPTLQNALTNSGAPIPRMPPSDPMNMFSCVDDALWPCGLQGDEGGTNVLHLEAQLSSYPVNLDSD